MLSEIKKSYITLANNIPNWKTLNKNELANLYLKYENVEPERSYYFSALMCRYWKNVLMLYNTSKSTKQELSDFTNWLAEALFTAFKYRKWTDPSNKLYNDPHAPDKVINRCIYSTRMRYYYHFNMDKRRLNFQTDSIERQLSSFGNQATVYSFLGVEDESASDKVCKEIILHYIDKNKILNAIVVDLICFNDTYVLKKTSSIVNDEEDETEVIMEDEDITEESDDTYVDNDIDFNDDVIEEIENEYEEVYEFEPEKYSSQTLEFSKRRFIKVIRALDRDYVTYFCSTYDVEKEKVESTIKKLRNADKSKQLSKILLGIFRLIANDKKVKELLCL